MVRKKMKERKGRSRERTSHFPTTGDKTPASPANKRDTGKKSPGGSSRSILGTGRPAIKGRTQEDQPEPPSSSPPAMAMTVEVLAGLAFMFSASILLQILACALYNNWWPMLSALMYVLVPMPCLFFGGGPSYNLINTDGGGWLDVAKFLTGASAVGSIAIPAILRHANLIEAGAMYIEFASFFILICTVLCYHRVNLEEDWYP